MQKYGIITSTENGGIIRETKFSAIGDNEAKARFSNFMRSFLKNHYPIASRVTLRRYDDSAIGSTDIAYAVKNREF